MPLDVDDSNKFFATLRVLFETAPDIPDEEEGAAAIALRAVLFAIKQGSAPPDWAALAVMSAMARYDDMEVTTLGEAFGFPPRTHLAAKRTEAIRASISFEVDRIQKQGRTSGNPIPLRSSRDQAGALELAGKRFNMSAATVAKYRNSWRELCKQAGRSPSASEIPSRADAEEVIASTLAENIAPSGKFSKHKKRKIK